MDALRARRGEDQREGGRHLHGAERRMQEGQVIRDGCCQRGEISETLYRVTHLVVQLVPLTVKQKLRFSVSVYSPYIQ